MRIPHDSGEYLLSYSTNVHPCETLAETVRMLGEDVVKVRNLLEYDQPFGVELRLGASAIRELRDPANIETLQDCLRDCGLFVFSLNAFPISPFHVESVKDQVYRPDWRRRERVEATVDCCTLLARLLPEDMDGTVSTSPGGFKPWGGEDSLREHYARNYAEVIMALDAIRERTGKRIRLAVEPEPFCTFETTGEFIEFVEQDLLGAGVSHIRAETCESEAKAAGMVRDHVGINLDACHLAVEFEDPREALGRLRDAGISVAKLHVSAAARVRDPAENDAGMDTLRTLDEPKYLHQTFAVDGAGEVVYRGRDLPDFLALPRDRLARFGEVRTHFHMPLDGDPDAPLGVTNDVTASLLDAYIASEQYGHIVTETYTWPLLASASGGESIHAGIARELSWTGARIAECLRTGTRGG